jgi:threonylcarbamoyladenosine tRNA methylthiotransferase MtaB
VAQAKFLAATGHRELVLSGIQLGFYRDPDGQASKLEDLLKMLLDETEGIRFRLGSMLPRHMRPALIDLFVQSKDRLCPHFHISLQSGDDDTLKAMKRPYRSGHFRELMQELWTRLDKPCLGTDVIAGFCGEDEAAFISTMTLIDKLPMAYGHVFPFSLRPGTPAEGLGDDIRPEVKKLRAAKLRALFDEKQEVYRRQQVGRRLEVLVETQHSKGWLRGTSENYQQVLVPEHQGAIGDLIPLEISGLEDGILCHHPQTKRVNS